MAKTDLKTWSLTVVIFANKTADTSKYYYNLTVVSYYLIPVVLFNARIAF